MLLLIKERRWAKEEELERNQERQVLEKERVIKNIRAELTTKEQQLVKMNKTVKRILNSYTYKTGRIMVSPFVLIKRLMGKK